MRLVLISYFDLGESYVIDDAVFTSEALPPGYDPGLIGVTNPLGRGIVLDLLAEDTTTVDRWRKEAERQVERPEMETGWLSDELPWSREQFDAQLKEFIRLHPLAKAQIAIYAVGAAVLEVEFGPGIPPALISGVARCFEFASYE